MNVTCVLLDTTDNAKSLTLASVDGSKITAVTSAASAPVRTINGDDLNRATQNVNNVGLTVSAFLTMQATVLEPAGSGLTTLVASHPTDNTLVLVTIDSQLRTLRAAELRDAVANCQRNS